MQERTLGDFFCTKSNFPMLAEKVGIGDFQRQVLDFVKMIKWVEAERKGTERFEMGKMTKI